MQGIVRTYLPEKGYGFIKGNDGKDYFFRKESFADAVHVGRIVEDALVTFDEQATPKGYRAVCLSLVNAGIETNFVFPDGVVTSKTNHLQGWDLLGTGDWIVHGMSSTSPDEARRILSQNANRIGANALIGVEYYKTTGSRGNYQFTVHNFRGRIALAGRRSARGTEKGVDLEALNLYARKAQQLEESKLESKRQHKRNVATALCAGGVLCLVVLSALWFVGVILFVAAGISLSVGSTYRWIEYSPVSASTFD